MIRFGTPCFLFVACVFSTLYFMLRFALLFLFQFDFFIAGVLFLFAVLLGFAPTSSD
jgi:hypothetical protein